jgi:tetratricopeptide (TPR) repeat protein
MTKLKIAFASLVLLLLQNTVVAQQTGVFTDAQSDYKSGLELFQQGVYEAAQVHFEEAMNAVQQPQNANFKLLHQQAQLKHAQCAIRLNHPDGEKLIRDFIRDNSPSSVANEALLDLGNYYFGQRKFDEAIRYYQQIPTLDMNNTLITEVKFKMGYAYLVKKKYKQAKSLFKQVKDIRGDYYYPANYYYGVTAFQGEDYKTAIASFERVKNSKKYSRDVPYYICQIAFAEGDYDKVIDYGKTQAQNTRIKKYREINKLIGQAYFEKKEYKKALPYLEEHAKSGQLRQEDLYQVGYTQYQTENYKAAIKNFDELKNLNSALGQNALYNLGDCHLKVDDKQSARNAFKKASQMDFDKKIKNESIFLYGKLSYELGASRDAIDAFQTIESSSNYYRESQELLSKVFLNTRDYKKALDIIESMSSKSLEIRRAYQKVAYYRGVQLINDEQKGQAREMFIKSLKNPYDNRTKALANYWIGEINYESGDNESSINDFNEFLTIAKSSPKLFTDEASVEMANYALGYNYIKKGDYTTAGRYFEQAVNGFATKVTRNTIDNDDVKNKVYPDALLRAGDCNLKNNKYTKALGFYNRVINRKADGNDYAYYQKSIIQGLQKDDAGKLVTLENLVKRSPNSDFADDALLELGSTYLQLNQLSEAAEPLKQLVKNYANKSNLVNSAYLKLGLIAYNQDNTEQALDYYKKVCTNNPTAEEKANALRSIQEIYVERGETDKYFAFLKTIDYNVSDKQKDDLSFDTAEAQYQNGNYDRAVSAFTNYIRAFPNGLHILNALYQRGESYFVKKKYDYALLDYENLINRGSNAYYVRSLRKGALISYNVSKDFDKAYNYYSKWTKIASGDELFEAQLGTVRSAYRLGGRKAEVYRLAETVKNNASASAMDKGEANYYIGKTALDDNNFSKAKSAFSEVTQYLSGEQKAEAFYQIAYITFREGKLTEAENLALNNQTEVEDYADWLARIYILLGDIYAQKGDLLNAQVYLEAIVENYDGDASILNEARAKLEKVKQEDANTSRLAPDNVGGSEGELEMEEDGNK